MTTLFLVLALATSASETSHTVDPATTVESWETRVHGVSLKLAQILPDQVRGFYFARGLDRDSVERPAA